MPKSKLTTCPHCSVKAVHRPWTGPPRIRQMCVSCASTFSLTHTNAPRGTKPKPDASIKAIYKALGVSRD